MKFDLDSVIADMVSAKRDEYLRMLDVGRCPLGKHSSMPRVIDYAIQILNWIDANRGDEAVESVMSRFVYTPSLRKIGRPSTLRGALNRIKPKQMAIIKNMLGVQGITDPSDEQILDVYNTAKMMGQPIGGDRRKANREAKSKMVESKVDENLSKLDEETRRKTNGK